MMNINDYVFGVLQNIKSHKRKLYVAYSAGVDSTSLLDICNKFCKLNSCIDLVAIYVNHNISKNSSKWLDHAKYFCSKNKIKLITENVEVILNKKGLENEARNKRWEAFEKIIIDKENSVLLLAHHADDQIETYLFRSFKGCSIFGLSSIYEKTVYDNIDVVRPFLNFEKKAIIDYASNNSLLFVEDESNLKDDFDRNFIRNSILPKVKTRWPKVSEVVSRNISLMQKDLSVLEEMLKDEFNKIKKNFCGIDYIDKYSFNGFSLQKRSLLLRFWIKYKGYYCPDKAKLDEFLRQIEFSGSDRKPLLRTKSYSLLLDRGQIFLISSKVYNFKQNNNVICDHFSSLDNLNILDGFCKLECDFNYLKKNITGIKDNCYIAFYNSSKSSYKFLRGKKTLKNILQKNNIPIFLRRYIPFVYNADGDLIFIANLALSQVYQLKEEYFYCSFNI